MSDKDVVILAIESSCDETAAAVVKNGREVLSSVISSQIDLHTLYGGVVPEIASRKHIEKIDYVVSQLDLLPTLYNLLKLNEPYTALGRDMLDASNPQNRAALVSEGVNIGLITADGAIRHSRKGIISVEKRNENFDEKKAEEILLSLDKTAYVLLKNNTWYKDE